MLGKYIRYTLQAIGLFTVLGVATVAAALPFLGVWLQPQDVPERSDYVVVLAGEDHRYLKAVELYNQGFAPVILLSNDVVPPLSRIGELLIELGYPYLHPYEFRQRLLRHLGVPKEAFTTFGTGSVSTVEEAEALKRFVGERPIKVILVTSPFHARRAKLIFESIMPRARFMVVSPPEKAIDGRWWRDQQSAILTALESLKIGYFWLGGAFRTSATGNS